LTLVTTHVLDTATGTPASGLRVSLCSLSHEGEWSVLGTAYTDGDGRVGRFPAVSSGSHRLVFETRSPFFPEVIVSFEAEDQKHLHVPLLLSPFGYSVYRGS
jgi:5-hydroxyisourate hydrolase